MKNLIKPKEIFDAYVRRKYHSNHKKIALITLKTIENVKGKTNLNLIKLADEYALDVFGSQIYAPWLYVYSAISGQFKEGWIPDNYYGKIVVPKLKGNYGIIGDFNGLTNRVFNSSYFPVKAYRINNLWWTPQYQVISDQDLSDIIFEKSEKVVFKIDNSIQGKGVYFFDKNNFSLDKVKGLGNGVFQKFIKQHSFFNNIMSKSVATIRITSVTNNEGKASIRSCYLRVGRIEDSHVKSSSHIRIPINVVTGELNMFGYNTFWQEIESHPDSEFVFQDKIIPSFNKCIEAALSLHEHIPFVRSIGWDMIIDENSEVQVMEWNGLHNDIKFSEATQGPCFSDLGWEKLWKF